MFCLLTYNVRGGGHPCQRQHPMLLPGRRGGPPRRAAAVMAVFLMHGSTTAGSTTADTMTPMASFAGPQLAEHGSVPLRRAGPRTPPISEREEAAHVAAAGGPKPSSRPCSTATLTPTTPARHRRRLPRLPTPGHTVGPIRLVVRDRRLPPIVRLSWCRCGRNPVTTARDEGTPLPRAPLPRGPHTSGRRRRQWRRPRQHPRGRPLTRRHGGRRRPPRWRAGARRRQGRENHPSVSRGWAGTLGNTGRAKKYT